MFGNTNLRMEDGLIETPITNLFIFFFLISSILLFSSAEDILSNKMAFT